MIEIAIAAAIIGGTIAVIDEQNVFPQLSNNPLKKWIWDPSRWTPATPPAARFSQPIQPRLSPSQQLSQARLAATGAQQQVDSIIRQNPSLATGSKYILTAPQQTTIQPVHPNQAYRGI